MNPLRAHFAERQKPLLAKQLIPVHRQKRGINALYIAAEKIAEVFNIREQILLQHTAQHIFRNQIAVGQPMRRIRDQRPCRGIIVRTVARLIKPEQGGNRRILCDMVK